MNLRQKYDHAIQIAKSLRMQGSADERDGKLHFNGVVSSEDEKNQIWNAIKTSAAGSRKSSGTSASRQRRRRAARPGRRQRHPRRPTP